MAEKRKNGAKRSSSGSRSAPKSKSGRTSGAGSSSRKKSSSRGRKKASLKSAGSGLLTTLAVFAMILVCIVGICIEKGILDSGDLPKINGIGVRGSPTAIEKDDNFSFGVYFLDVGQGDSELITSGDTAVLIDAGEAEYGKYVTDFIKSLGIKKLDYIIATHPHSDHIGGMAEVINSFEVGKVIVPKLPESKVPTTSVYENFLTAVKDNGLKLTAAAAGNTYDIGDAQLEILGPMYDYYDDLNDFSVVCRVTYGDTAFMFTGDASQPAESDLCGSGAELSADVLKAGHHGSKTASTKAFLEKVSPKACVIEVGKDNSYGHPTDEALKRIEKYTSNIYRTDLNGTVVIYSDKKQLYIKAEK